MSAKEKFLLATMIAGHGFATAAAAYEKAFEERGGAGRKSASEAVMRAVVKAMESDATHKAVN